MDRELIAVGKFTVILAAFIVVATVLIAYLSK